MQYGIKKRQAAVDVLQAKRDAIDAAADKKTKKQQKRVEGSGE